jgi:hypothetical protein
MLAMTGRVTMLGISRWTEPGGSYRTIQRFYNTTIVWVKVHWLLIRHHLLEPEETMLLAGDETVVTKAGDKTYGLDRFFSSLYGKPVPGLSFLALSLVSVKQRQSHPILMEQVVKPASEKAKPKAAKAKPVKRKRGRPKGSRNKNRAEVELSPYLLQLQQMIKTVLQVIGLELKLAYCVLDGAFGHNNGVQMVQQCGLQLISKLRSDAALYLPYDGPQPNRGRRKKYGQKLDYTNLPAEYLKSSKVDKGLQTDIYQLQVWHKRFADPLNVVIIVKTKLTTQARAHLILFSTDLELGYEQLIDYYCLRFQLEFNFRDAKQFWGLEDFMNVKQQPVHNAANLAMFMVNLSRLLLQDFQQTCPAFSVNDLKAHFRGRKYVAETLKLLPQPPEPILIDQIYADIAQLGRINPA